MDVRQQDLDGDVELEGVREEDGGGEHQDDDLGQPAQIEKLLIQNAQIRGVVSLFVDKWRAKTLQIDIMSEKRRKGELFRRKLEVHESI